MSSWPSSKARKVLRGVERIGWKERIGGAKGSSHRQLFHASYAEPFTWAFHDADELGPVMLARIAKRTGLKPEDL